MFDSPLPSPLEQTVVIVGVGLIGGSLAAAMKRRNVARTVIGVGRDSSRIESARESGLIDVATTDVSTVVHQADLIVFCTPVDRVANDVRRAVLALENRSQSDADSEAAFKVLLTDVGSVKEPICNSLSDEFRFIGSHPIAGSHRQGFEAADASLFAGRTCVLTPVLTSPQAQIQRLERFWQAVGMQTVQMSPSAHDRALAMTSHLPHLLAAALASTLSDENRPLTGSGFRETTRVAAGDAELWTGILMNNAESVILGIDEIQQRIASFRDALRTRDSAAIRTLLADGQLSRSALDQVAFGPD